MTYLDTHIVIWLYEGDTSKLSRVAAERVQNDDLFISPAVALELEFLHGIRRLTRTSDLIVESLASEIGLSICQLAFPAVVQEAMRLKWGRDPFDRLIVAHASANDAPLITKDEKIRRHYKRAVW